MEFVIFGCVVMCLAFYLLVIRPDTKRLSDWLAGFNWDVLLSPEVQACLPHNKIDAVKIYQQRTNTGLKESVDIIEYIVAHPERIPSMEKSGGIPTKIRHYDLVEQQSDGIRDLLREGKRDEARKTYQAFTGVDQFTANEAIDALEKEIQAEAERYDEYSNLNAHSKQKG